MEWACGAEKSAKPNREILLQLCGEAIDSLTADAPIPDSSRVFLKVEEGDLDRFFASAFTTSFHHKFSSLYTQPVASGIQISVSVATAAVAYGQSFSESFLSARVCERSVEVDLRFTALRVDDGKILWAGVKKASLRDTIYVAEISALEETSARIARGVVPQPSVFERIIEPFIIVGAAGVAVYLFFTIRS